MDPTLQYAILAAVGAISGLGVYRLSASVRGSMKKRFLITRLLEGLLAAPGIGLALFFFAGREGTPNLFDMLRVMGAFFVPYVGTRIAMYVATFSHSDRRDDAWPFAHWFGLLRTDPTAAGKFLTAYLAQYDQRKADLLLTLHAGCASLTQGHGADPLLPAALDRLRLEIARLEGAHARSSGTPGLP